MLNYKKAKSFFESIFTNYDKRSLIFILHNMKGRTLPIVLFLLIFCRMSLNAQIPIWVSATANEVERNAASKLATHLAELYPHQEFPVTFSYPNSERFILMSSDRSMIKNIALPDSPFQDSKNFIVSHLKRNNQEIGVILGLNPKGVLNGVYALLEEYGFGFYLSFESAPPPLDEFNFERWNLSDSPLVGERIVFNWHNFLSGSSTWDLPEWKTWIDHSSKMRFNTIMVHAYGNNPMFTYTFNGKTKKVSRLPATEGGRDYGTQQVNDVRRLHGGEVFHQSVFGAKASQVETKQHVDTVQALMRNVFSYAEQQGMKIIFAFDIDTSPANPQELIRTLPPSAQICFSIEKDAYFGRFQENLCIANPETPEGYLFYKSQIVSLLKLYPQIDQIVPWMRKRNSEVLSLGLEYLPLDWQTEYKGIEERHPQVSEWEDAPGRFVSGKIITAFQKILKDVGRQDVVLKAGSWASAWMEPADLFFPKGLGFIALDYNVLHGPSFVDLPEQQKRLAGISQKRSVTPIFWAHHDDGAYIGRPYIPIRNLQNKLSNIGADGFGIIHWTTWPLDPYFKNMSLQVWERSRNQDYKVTLDSLAKDLFGGKQQALTSSYLNEWATSAPMMGRETREWWINDAYTDSLVQTVAEGSKYRLGLLEAIDKDKLTESGKEYFGYFKGLENFSIDFYKAENAYQRSLKYRAKGLIEEAIEAILLCEPEKLISQYAKFSAEKGITKGEKGVIISMNLSWLPFIESQRQSLGLSPIRYNFGPTIRPRFGQGLLRTNFFVDKEQRLWRNYGNEETGALAYNLKMDSQLKKDDSSSAAYKEICTSGIVSDTALSFSMKPIMADIRPSGPTENLIASNLRPGEYELKVWFAPPGMSEKREASVIDVSVYNNRNKLPVISERIRRGKGKNNFKTLVKTYKVSVEDNEEVILELTPVRGKISICGAVLNWLKE